MEVTRCHPWLGRRVPARPQSLVGSVGQVYAFWTQATSVIALAVSYSAVVTLLSPTAPIKPSSRMATMAATCSPKGDPSFGMATEVDHGYLVELQGDEVGQYPFARLLRALRLVYAAGVVATGPYFRYQHQLARVEIERGVDQLVRTAGP
jgi:hypothetical protein